VHNQWYDILCATLYFDTTLQRYNFLFPSCFGTKHICRYDHK